jgi:hypothetical protein
MRSTSESTWNETHRLFLRLRYARIAISLSGITIS